MTSQPTAPSPSYIVLVAVNVFTAVVGGAEMGHALIRLINRLLARRAGLRAARQGRNSIDILTWE